MRLLLDTHVALWAITDSPRLSSQARELILTPTNRIFVSVASLWEIAIKHGLGRGDMPLSGKEAMGYFQQSGYTFLAISPEHAVGVERLPSHHQDPFDRILVSQAINEPLRLLTHDAIVAKYSDLAILV